MIETRDPPPMRCGNELRRSRPARRRFFRWLLIGAIGVAALFATIAFPPMPRFVWNASASAPIGLYHVRPGTPARTGDTVIAWLPEHVRRFAAKRRYLPMNVPLVKRVAASPGDRVCAIGEAIFVDGRRIARRLKRDGSGRPMPWWRGCRVLRQGELFLLMKGAPASFDGRYFGVTTSADMIGKAGLIWAKPPKGSSDA